MSDLTAINSLICHLSVGSLVVLSVVTAVKVCRSTPGALGAGTRLALPVFALGLLMRSLATWGPHVSSGRDLGYIDNAILGGYSPHTGLLSTTYWFLKYLADPLYGLVWGQLILGSLGCGLVALLTYSLCRRELPALFAGLLAALLVVLIRVDAGPSVLVTMRFYLLLTLILAVHYLRTRSILALAGAACGIVALSYGRLENLLLSGLILVWLATDSDEEEAKPWLALSVVLCLTMFAALLNRWLLPPAAVLIGVLLWRRNGGRLAPRAVLVAGICIAVLLVFRALELMPLERETHSRFPVSLLYLFGRLNILLFDPGLCTPLVVLFFALGIWKTRRREGAVLKYLACFGIPTFSLYLLFMGDTSARLKLQGTGIMLLLPMAGLGAEWVVECLSRWWRNQFQRSLALGLLVTAVSVPLGLNTLGIVTTLQQEYRFLLSLDEHLEKNSIIYAPPWSEMRTLIRIPEVIQQRTGIRVQEITSAGPYPTKPGDLVFLGAGCRRFHDGKPLPGIGKTLTQCALEYKAWPRWLLILKAAWSRRDTLMQVFDALDVGEWDVCEKLRTDLGLAPVNTRTAKRTRLEGRWMPERFPFGLYQVTR